MVLEMVRSEWTPARSAIPLCRCLLLGSNHDLEVVFRLCQLLFSLGSDADVVKHMGAISKEVASYKFLPLAYQLASRLSKPGRNAALDASGFTVTLPSHTPTPFQLLHEICWLQLHHMCELSCILY